MTDKARDFEAEAQKILSDAVLSDDPDFWAKTRSDLARLLRCEDILRRVVEEGCLDFETDLKVEARAALKGTP